MDSTIVQSPNSQKQFVKELDRAMDSTIGQSRNSQKQFVNQPQMIHSLSRYWRTLQSLYTQPDIPRRSYKSENKPKDRQGRQPLLPGLPDDLAIACLVRVPRAQHNKLHFVCKKWHRLLMGNFYYTLRENLGLSEEWVHIIKRDGDGKISWISFDPVFNTWHPLPLIPCDFKKSVGFGCATLSRCHMYLLGGKEKLTDCNRRAVVYNARTNRWHRVPDLLRKRSFFSSCVINNCIYVAGGEHQGSQRVIRSGEVYDPIKNCWKFIADVGAAMLPYVGVVYDGKWFLKGLGSHREVHSEVYIPETGAWMAVRDEMVAGLRNHTVVMNGRLYGLDSRNGWKINIFDECSSTWEVCVDRDFQMGNNRAHEVAALVPLKGKLCIVPNNMSMTMVDLSIANALGECNPGILEHVDGKTQTRDRISRLWSSFSSKGERKSHIIHCQVLRA